MKIVNLKGTPSSSVTGRRLWLFRILAITVIPAILLLLVEVGLRIAGYGYPASAIITCRVKGQEVYCNNAKFAWQFFPKKIAREFYPFTFPADKPDNTYRIFVLGASAAQGAPAGEYCFGRMIEVMLREMYPEVNFEVITLAMPAINSHAVLKIAAECPDYQSDLFVVYLGNNEVVGPYGAGTIFAPISSSLSFIRAQMAFRATRFGQLLNDLSETVGTRRNSPVVWKGMGMFLEKQVRADSDQLQIVHRHYQKNLEDIARIAQKNNTPAIFSSVGCNLKDSPPFASVHQAGKVGEGFAGAALRDGKVYLLDRVKSAEDVLRCYDIETGDELWSFANKDPGKFDFDGSRNPPTIDEKNVYCVGGMGTVYCISRSTHKAVWKKDFKKDFGAECPMWGFSQSPLLYKDLVIVAPQCAKAGAVAYNADTGEVVWKTPQLCGDPGYSSPMLTTIDGVDQVVLMTSLNPPEEDEDEDEDADEDEDPDAEDEGPPFEGGGLYGIDAGTGEILWNYKGITCKITIPPVTLIGDGRIFVTGGYEAGSAMIKVVRKLGKFQVHELFKTDEYDAQIHPALLYKDHLYMSGNGNSRREGLMCLTLDGKVLWKTRRKPSFGRGGLILADGMIYIVEGDKGHLYLVKATPKEYTELGMVKKILKGEAMWAPLALADGKLVIRDQQHLKCLDVKEASVSKK